MRSNRFLYLEGARGIASIIVIFHHFCMAFFPIAKASVLEGGLKYTPLFLFVNGEGAVTFFFVLSGFVLTLGFYQRFSLSAVIGASIKRLPRLMLPAAASIFLGFLILKYGGGANIPASMISKSDWLKTFGNAQAPLNLRPSLLDAAKQTLLVFLIPNNFYYNSNLWTMLNEFYGSMLVFILALIFSFQSLSRRRTVLGLHVVITVLFGIIYPPIAPFVAGSLIAFFYANRKGNFQLSRTVLAGLLFGSIVCFSTARWYFTLGGSVFTIVALLGSQFAQNIFDNRTSYTLGKISFPIYLIHTLVILFISSSIFTTLTSENINASLVLLIVLATTLCFSLILCIPFYFLDKIWVSWLSVKTRKLVAIFAESDHVTANRLG